jgi:gluconolactonase
MIYQDDNFSKILSENSELKLLETGFQLTEGPLWNIDEGYLIFSDIYADRIHRWVPGEGVDVYREPSGNSNGLTYDKEGRLLICEHGNRRIARINENDVYEILAESFMGKRLNSPNDVVVKSDGNIYFTDPPYGIKPEEQELHCNGVYMLDPENKILELLVDDFERPNGLTFSPDESVMYIADSAPQRRHIRIFKVNSDGRLTGGRVFAVINSKMLGNPDGMKVDVEGNLYVAAASGIWIFKKNGVNLGIIRTTETRPTNCAWGENDNRTLFITTRTSVYRIKLKIPGVKVP